MIGVDEAVARIVAAFAPVESETIPIGAAQGRVQAVDAVALLDQPPFPASAMDGYALRAGDPPPLRLIGQAAAGHPFSGAVGAGEAIRIFTGAVVPDGADTILIQEDAKTEGDRLSFAEPLRPGRHIRAAGLDFKKGEVLTKAGRRLTPRDLALLAAGDIASVAVRRKPVIAFVATGDELSRPGEARRPGGITASSGAGLAALIDKWGGAPRDLGILPDRIEAMASLALVKADLIVTLGGASVGDADLVQSLPGFNLDFWKVAMRPGKPLIFSKLGTTPLLGLPGNPVSAFVCALLFLQPAIAAMLALPQETEFLQARLAGALAANGGRQDYPRATLRMENGEYWAQPFAVQDSSMLSVLARADGLIVRPPNDPARQTGDMVRVLPLK
jgi:molybdopterin molybdotransferase